MLQNDISIQRNVKTKNRFNTVREPSVFYLETRATTWGTVKVSD